MICKIAMSLMLTAFVGTVIGCGGAVSEEEMKAWADESGAFAKDYAEASTTLAEVKATHSTMAVADMDEAAKAKYDEASAKLSEYEQQLQQIGDEWTKVMGEIGDGTDAAAWKTGVENARKFVADNKAKLEEVKNSIAAIKDEAANMAAAPATGDSTAAPADGAADPAAAPAEGGENADANNAEGEKKEGM